MCEGERDYRDFLIDILKAIEEIETFVRNTDFEAFIENTQKVYATIYCLQIIGEAVKNLPEDIKERYQKIPWRKIAGMRDRLIHGYFIVDFERVWKTVKSDIPLLKEARISKELYSTR